MSQIHLKSHSESLFWQTHIPQVLSSHRLLNHNNSIQTQSSFKNIKVRRTER